MIKTLKLTIYFLLFSPASLLAQTVSHDSIVNIATVDGKKLRLTSAQRQIFKADGRNAGSDFFKPKAVNVSNALLLKDSVYVQAFRLAAYKRNRRSTGHYILWGGIVVYGAACIIDIIASSSTLPAPGSFKID